MGFLATDIGESTTVDSLSSEAVTWGRGVEQREAGEEVAIGLEPVLDFFTFLDNPTLRTMFVKLIFVDTKHKDTKLAVLQLRGRGPTLQEVEGES